MRRTAATTVLLALLGALTPAAAPAGAAEPAANKAAAWIAGQQQADGGFEVSGFPGFETPDAALAIGEASLSGPGWNATAARNAVASVTRNGRNAFDYLDDFSEAKAANQTGSLGAGQAAKLIVLTARPFAFSATAFDPQGDGAVDLVQILDGGAQSNGSYGTFNATLFAALAKGAATAAATRNRIVAAQQANGGWSFSGDSAGTDEDVDTTSLAVQALVATGTAGPVGDAVARAVRFLVDHQQPNGSWLAFGAPDPNSTAMAVLAITAAGFDVDDPCWRNLGDATRRGRSYTSPLTFLRNAQQSDGRIASPNDEFGVNTFATAQTVEALTRSWLPLARRSGPPCPGDGYVLFAADGGVFAFGPWGRFFGSLGSLRIKAPVVGGALTPTGRGYWMFARDGGVFAFGDAPFRGSTGAMVLNQPVVGGAATPSGQGYWLFAADGGVFAFGDARFFGSTGGLRLNQPVVGGAATPSGKGYLLFARDGGVFAFGDATFRGSTGSIALNQPVVGGAARPGGSGYWLFARDGGVFAFGDAPFLGSMGGAVSNASGGFAHSSGRGYWIVGADGIVYNFGAATQHGSAGGALNFPVVGGAA